MELLRYNFNRSKYGSKKTVVDGKVFDSQKEARRYSTLLMLEKAGEISELECQKVFELIPARYEMIETGEVYKRGINQGKPKTKRVCVEHPVTYIADYVYKDSSGDLVVEDVKSPATRKKESYIIKRKLMLFIHNIKIKEV